MTETEVGKIRRRKPLTAVVLSLIMPGLGHIYCGRIVKGIILSFLSSILVPVAFVTLLISRSSLRIAVVIAALFAYLVVWLVAIIDSWYTAKHTMEGYTLKDYNRWYVYALLVLMGAGGPPEIAFNVRANYIEAFRIPKGASSYPTIEPGDRILANKTAYNKNDPQRGDVVVFIYPEDRRWNHIKRVVAVAGDTVEIKNNDLYINGQKLERTSEGRSTLLEKKRKTEGEVFLEKNGQTEYRIFLTDSDEGQKYKSTDFALITVPAHHCFVLGDNRNNSRDSRHFGPIHIALIKGRADYLYWPAEGWSRFGRIH